MRFFRIFFISLIRLIQTRPLINIGLNEDILFFYIASPIKANTKRWAILKQLSLIKYFLKFNFLYQGRERPAKKKLVSAKLGVRQILRKNNMFFILYIDIRFFLSLTLRSDSLHRVTFFAIISAKTNFYEKPFLPPYLLYQGRR